MADFMEWLRYKSQVRTLAKAWVASDAESRCRIEAYTDFRLEFSPKESGQPDSDLIHRAAEGGFIRWFMREHRIRRAALDYLRAAVISRQFGDIDAHYGIIHKYNLRDVEQKAYWRDIPNFMLHSWVS